MKTEWYKEWFSNKLYLELYSNRNEKEAEDLINLIQRTISIHTGSKILDVCCGSGRHSIALAKRGYDVTGFDLSKYLISQAVKEKKKLIENNIKLNFMIKDMRKFDFGNSFDAVINVFSSFGYFDNDKENFSVFSNANKSLKEKGFFAFDYMNESYLKTNLIKFSKSVINGKTIRQKRRIENDFVIKDILTENKTYTERVKLYSLKDIYNALSSFNFRVINIFGDYFGNNFNLDKSKRLIVFAQKK